MGFRLALLFSAVVGSLTSCRDQTPATGNSTKTPSNGTPNSPTGTGSGTLSILGVPSEARQDFSFSFTPAVNNPRHASLTFTASGLPPWASLNASTGAITGSPAGPATYTAFLKVSDGQSEAVLSPLKINVVGDPLRPDAWHIQNTGQKAYASGAGTAGIDLNVLDAWRAGYTGQGVRVAVSDSGLEVSHEDLAPNVLAGLSKDYRTSAPYFGDPSPDPAATDGDHGTSVAGLIAAKGWNGIGSRGIAPNAGLAGLNFLNDDVSQTTSILVDQANGAYDIFNQSWGADAEGDSTLSTTYQNQLAYGVSSLRGGRGALYVKAAGNSYQPYSNASWMTLDSTTDPFNSTPYTVVVGALNADGNKASYASIGSCIWVSALGGEYGTTKPALISTDEMTCSRGFSRTSATENAFEKGGTGNANCNYTSAFNGTSGATPQVSGVIALMLEANPLLSWREVKHILASTAIPLPASSPIQNRSVDPAGYVWDPGWVTNGAGYKFHNFYGFGRVNAAAAVERARTWSTPFKPLLSSSLDSGAISLTIPDNNAAGVTHTMGMGAGLSIEAVVLTVSATHPYTGDLAVELTSPMGTKSILLHANNAFADDADFVGFRLLSNAFYGESSFGNWKIRVLDASPGESGTRRLTNWKLVVYGQSF